MREHNSKIELLAPAGGMEAFLAAMNHGADAVYLGGSAFSARKSAANFTEDELCQALDYAHVRDKKVYLAINTLIENSEMDKALELTFSAYLNGVDAIITQDAGFAALVRQHMPLLDIFASTQMTICNAEQIARLEAAGFRRVILARELTLPQIRSLVDSTTMELEVFVHGAMCICYSGQCLLSSMIGGRSANRGSCAQPCRLPWSLEEKKAYLLSPRDLCTLGFLGQVAESGIRSVKIEGRMKSPEYVAEVVRIYRKYLDSIEREGTEHYHAEPEDLAALRRVFSRGEFTPGYFLGKQYGKLINDRNPDGKQEWKKEASEIGIGEEVSAEVGAKAETWAAAGAGAVARAAKQPGEVRGDEESRAGTVPVFGSLTIAAGCRPELRIRDRQGLFCSVLGETSPQTADKKPLTQETVLRQMRKTGDTPFYFEDFSVELDEGLFIPVSELNRLRRDGLEAFETLKATSRRRSADGTVGFTTKTATVTEASPSRRRSADSTAPAEANPATAADTVLSVLINRVEQDFSLEGIDADRLYLPLDSLCQRKVYEAAHSWMRQQKKCTEVFAVLHGIVGQGEWQEIRERLETVRPILTGVLAGSAGLPEWLLPAGLSEPRPLTLTPDDSTKQMPAAELTDSVVDHSRTGFKVHVDASANVMNTVSLGKLIESGVSCVTLSHELGGRRLYEAAGDLGAFCEVMVYGRQRLLISEYCPVGGKNGCSQEKKQCPAMGRFWMMDDRMGLQFPGLSDPRTCRSVLFNTKTLCLDSEVKGLKQGGIASLRIDFTTETAEERANITALYRDLLKSGVRCLERHRETITKIRESGATRGYFSADKKQFVQH